MDWVWQRAEKALFLIEVEEFFEGPAGCLGDDSEGAGDALAIDREAKGGVGHFRLHGFHTSFHLVELGLDASEFFFDFKDVLYFGGAGEEGAEPVAEGAFVFEGGLEVEVGDGDVGHFDSF